MERANEPSSDPRLQSPQCLVRSNTGQSRKEKTGWQTYDEGLVMLLKLSKSAAGSVGSHCQTQRPLIVGAGIPLEDFGRNEGLKNEPTAKINTAEPLRTKLRTRSARDSPPHAVCAKVPGSVERGGPGIGIRIVAVRAIRILNPCR